MRRVMSARHGRWPPHLLSRRRRDRNDTTRGCQRCCRPSKAQTSRGQRRTRLQVLGACKAQPASKVDEPDGGDLHGWWGGCSTVEGGEFTEWEEAAAGAQPLQHYH